MILTINISNSNNLNKFWVDIFTRQGQSSLLNRSEWVSESVSVWVSDKGKQWSDAGPIKMHLLVSQPTNFGIVDPLFLPKVWYGPNF